MPPNYLSMRVFDHPYLPPVFIIFSKPPHILICTNLLPQIIEPATAYVLGKTSPPPPPGIKRSRYVSYFSRGGGEFVGF